MIVAELIEKLKEFDSNLEIVDYRREKLNKINLVDYFRDDLGQMINKKCVRLA